MIIGCFICVFAVLINKVSLQVPEEGFIGGSVVLPCSSSEHKPQDTNVHWRHNGSEIVCDIIKGGDSVEKQDQRYKNRVETFPDEYIRGNFSIRLNSLQYTDAGKYICFITPSSELQTVLLIINESTAENESNSTEQENQGEDTETDTVETSSNRIYVVLAVLLLFILSIACLIVFYSKKKNQDALFSSVSTEDSEQEHN